MKNINDIKPWGEEIMLFDYDWHRVDLANFADCQTLQDYSDHYFAEHPNYLGTLFLMTISALEGKFYQFGNYDKEHWTFWGTNIGYA